MKIYKFGGTSVGTPERMKEVCHLITGDGEQKIVVLSAMSGTTNSLVEIADYFRKGNPEGASNMVNALRRQYHQHVPVLHEQEEVRAKIYSSNSMISEDASFLMQMKKLYSQKGKS